MFDFNVLKYVYVVIKT